ncbi:11785_t:CDS:2 [Rhizophagus irregularis]|nr:11785_t:CDS:2 [Rhizophagus irregularis]
MTTKKLQVILVTETKISIKALNTEEMVEKNHHCARKKDSQRHQTKSRKDKLPTTIDEIKLSQIACKYLEIPAMSVSSKMLFSHASSNFSEKNMFRYKFGRLDVIFEKKNSFMKVFAKEFDKTEEILLD